MRKSIIISLFLILLTSRTLQNKSGEYMLDIINIIKNCRYNKNSFTIYTYLSLINIESNFNPSAKGNKEEAGLMQISPTVAKKYNYKRSDLFLIDKNICLGIRYLEDLYDYYQKDKLKAIYAYNAGFKKIDKKSMLESPYIKKFLLNHFNFSEKFYER